MLDRFRSATSCDNNQSLPVSYQSRSELSYLISSYPAKRDRTDVWNFLLDVVGSCFFSFNLHQPLSLFLSTKPNQTAKPIKTPRIYILKILLTHEIVYKSFVGSSLINARPLTRIYKAPLANDMIADRSLLILL